MNVEFFPCSGLWALASRRAGIEYDLAIDVDPVACASYAQNMGHAPLCLDARDFLRMLEHVIPLRPVALVVADPPCTPWRRAGKRKGLGDERDMLSTTMRVIDRLRPTAWLIGNVPGLDDEPNWPVVQQVIGSVRGYCVDYARFDAADFGVPQHRVRPFWFGHAFGTPCLRWPSPTHGDPRALGHSALGDDRLPWVTCSQALAHLWPEERGKPVAVNWEKRRAPARAAVTAPAEMPLRRAACVDTSLFSLEPRAPSLRRPPTARRVLHAPSCPNSPARTLTCNTHGDGVLLGTHKHPVDGVATDGDANTTPASNHRPSQPSQPLAWPWDRPATTLTSRDDISQAGRSGSSGMAPSWNAIKLSERAAAILQGAPEGWHFAGRTKKERFAQIGMGMPPGLAEPIMQRIARWLAEARATDAGLS